MNYEQVIFNYPCCCRGIFDLWFGFGYFIQYLSMGNVKRTRHAKHAKGSGGKRIGAGPKFKPPTKTVSFKIPLFINPFHETEIKETVRSVIKEFIEGKERVE